MQWEWGIHGGWGHAKKQTDVGFYWPSCPSVKLLYASPNETTRRFPTRVSSISLLTHVALFCLHFQPTYVSINKENTFSLFTKTLNLHSNVTICLYNFLFLPKALSPSIDITAVEILENIVYFCLSIISWILQVLFSKSSLSLVNLDSNIFLND